MNIILTLNIRISILLVDRAGTNKTIKNKIEYEISVEIIFIENNSLLSKLIFSLLFLTFAHSLIAYVDIPSAANILKYCIIELLKFIAPIPSLPKTDVTYLNVINGKTVVNIVLRKFKSILTFNDFCLYFIRYHSFIDSFFNNR